jgi:hypothetical protein
LANFKRIEPATETEFDMNYLWTKKGISVLERPDGFYLTIRSDGYKPKDPKLGENGKMILAGPFLVRKDCEQFAIKKYGY